MYNEEVKETFLQYLIDEEGYTEETVHVFRFVFYKSYDVEDVLQKDMYDFNMSELKQVLLNANKSTLNSVRAFASMIKKYIDWAIRTGLTNSNINPMEMFTVSDYEECIDKSRKLFISEEELIEIEDQLVNYQDKVILRLLFEVDFEDDNVSFINPANDIPINNTIWGMYGFSSEEEYKRAIENGDYLPF